MTDIHDTFQGLLAGCARARSGTSSAAHHPGGAAVSAQFGHWHGLAVSDDGVDVLHSHHCPWSVRFHPRTVGTSGLVLAEAIHVCEYECDVASDIESRGFEAFPTEHGFYWFRLEHITYPSGPWGPAEYDMASQWVRIERPRMEVEPATLGEPS